MKESLIAESLSNFIAPSVAMEKVLGLGQPQKWLFGFDPPSELVIDSIEDTPWKVKGRRVLLNLECSIHYDVREHHLSARLMLVSVWGFWALMSCGCWVGGHFWVVGVLAVFWVLGLWEPLCIWPVYLGVPYAFSIKFFITCQKKKKKKIHIIQSVSRVPNFFFY